MRCLLLALWLGLLPVAADAATYRLAWTYTPQPQDRRFTVQRCENRPTGCLMATIATLGLTQRRYTDHTARARRTYCYQVRTETLQSNQVCTP